MSLVGKFFHMTQNEGQDPREYWSDYNDVIGSLEAALEQKIPKRLVFARFLDGLTSDYEFQKQTLLPQNNIDVEELLRVLRTRYGALKGEKGKRSHALMATERKVGKGNKKKRQGGQTSKETKTDGGEDSSGNTKTCRFCEKVGHYASLCPERFCEKC